MMRGLTGLAAAAAIAALIILAAPFVGAIDVSWRSLFAEDHSIASRVLWEIRIPRIIVAALAGAALSVSGMAFQALFRNPLAAPYTLGVSGGAALGAALYVRLGWTFAFAGVGGLTWAALAGAAGAILLVYGAACLRGGFDVATLLLAGVAISLSATSLILFIQYTADMYDTFRLVHWMMGGFGLVGYGDAGRLLLPCIGGTAAVLALAPELNQLLTGDEVAASRGVRVAAVQRTLFAAVSIMTGCVVAVVGPIGFVGLMAPHICRLLTGPDHRVLGPASVLFGAGFLVLCDTIARTIIAPAEIPAGVLTALLGGPFFLWLLLTRRK